MSAPRKQRRRQQQLALPGVGKSLPRRKPIARSDRGWDIGVLQSGSAYAGIGAFYATEGEAWQAIKAGVGAAPQEPHATTIHVSVYLAPLRHRR